MTDHGDPTLRRVAVLVGGHPYDAAAFDSLCRELGRRLGADEAGMPPTIEIVTWPAAEAVFAPAAVDALDALVLYDIPGLGLRRGEPPVPSEPSAAVIEGWRHIAATGLGVVALHHAIAAWPLWPEFAEVLGGRFHYIPATLRGVAHPDSGYLHEVDQQLTVVAPEHPVCAGLPDTFRLVDETYVCPVFEADVVPLIATDARLDDGNHWSAWLAVNGRRGSRDGWHHPPGTPLAAWAKPLGAGRLVYVQPGDGPAAMLDPNYQQLVANAVRWVAAGRVREAAAHG